ncbi:hypothetical protein FB107DRAFT_207744 [Schizophyllum commune]
MIRRGLGIPLRKRCIVLGDEETEVEVFRVLRIITTERLNPLIKLKGKDLVTAWFQGAQGAYHPFREIASEVNALIVRVVHYLNWRNGIHHKDPSLNNLMYRESQGHICAVLNDWDLASDAMKPHTHTGFETTGTLQFMAIDRLERKALNGAVPHLYRHDLEAFIWILVWVVYCIKDGKLLEPLPESLKNLTSGDANLCQHAKFHFVKFGHNVIQPSPTWVAESRLTEYLRLYLNKVNSRSAAVVFDVTENTVPPKEEDEPEKEWKDFLQVLREASQRGPTQDYILDLLTE